MKKYLCQYKDNETGELKELEFEAKNDAEARLVAIEFCDQGWHKLYGVIRIS